MATATSASRLTSTASAAFFADKHVVVDEMHGSGRGYLTRLLGEAGVPYTVIHAEVDPDLGEARLCQP